MQDFKSKTEKFYYTPKGFLGMMDAGVSFMGITYLSTLLN